MKIWETLGLILIIGVVAVSAYLMRPSQQYQDAANNQASQSAPLPTLCSNIEIDEQAKQSRVRTEKEIEDCATTRSDLAAQWSMADTTFIGVCVGFIGLVFIAWTLAATRDGVSVARDIGQKQARAYLQVSSSYPSPLVPSEQIRIAAAVKNVGQSPALKIDTRFKLCVIAEQNLSNAARIDAIFDDLDQLGFSETLQPGEEKEFGHYFTDGEINKDPVKMLADNNAAIVVALAINYEDVFGDKRLERSFHQLNVETDKSRLVSVPNQSKSY